MSVGYKAVQWNRQKRIYDVILWLSVFLYLWGFMTFTEKAGDNLDTHGVAIRAYGSAAFILLHIILSIGPLSRLNPKFLPLLFNRRHMGVTMFFLALAHVDGWKILKLPWELFGAKAPKFPWDFNGALTWYHDFGDLDPLVSLFVGNTHYGDFILFPFEFLGVIALFILFLMAATSHDFWLANLTAPIWKALHMGVYLAYGLLVGHVVLGALQTNKHPSLTIAVLVGMVWIVGLHLITGYREFQKDKKALFLTTNDFVEVGTIDEIPESRAKVVIVSGERVAIFKYEGKISAVSNVCQHQNGPLGEGKIVEGCITCPWHGYQYLPESGASPPPFEERIPTFAVKVEGDRIFVSTTPNPPGTRVEPALIT
ncbi:Assimilatory nitrite reductase [NAD(P)H] small subunit [Acaryochloris thomasi RCC1774]|uniref:Assimilatory nitrite reductase [NAD(P)H] small subunit n=1 Tax=Acaryochloris thomasi RCC1774 TaxID=1764569 RepID=A0A2W1JJ55_9CYAN|nr:Rieske 2Fe-2S domain-containing protein [Acaryochloris thomasi]PZD73490.1 Assimilatory nitrite reductase [NAD(P)H] small subunit [Acaryochloris thomasi RCC1774]